MVRCGRGCVDWREFNKYRNNLPPPTCEPLPVWEPSSLRETMAPTKQLELERMYTRKHLASIEFAQMFSAAHRGWLQSLFMPRMPAVRLSESGGRPNTFDLTWRVDIWV